MSIDRWIVLVRLSSCAAMSSQLNTEDGHRAQWDFVPLHDRRSGLLVSAITGFRVFPDALRSLKHGDWRHDTPIPFPRIGRGWIFLFWAWDGTQDIIYAKHVLPPSPTPSLSYFLL